MNPPRKGNIALNPEKPLDAHAICAHGGARIPNTDTHIHATCYRAAGADPQATMVGVLERCVAAQVDRAGVVEHLGGPKHPLSCLFDLSEAFRACEHPLPAAVGVELNMVDESGELSGTEEDCQAAQMGFALAGIHWTPPGIRTTQECLAHNHRVIMAALVNNPWIDVVVHPWRTARAERLRTPDEPWQFSLVPDNIIDEFVDELLLRSVACEIHRCDEVDFPDPAFGAFVGKLLDRGVPLAVGSDVHGLDGIGRANSICKFLAAYGAASGDVWFPGS